MNPEPIDWDEDLPPASPEEEYQALRRAISYSGGFNLLFVQCAPAEGRRITERIKEDLSCKKVATIQLKASITNFYKEVEALSNYSEIEVLFVQGLECSIYEYEDFKRSLGWTEGEIQSYSWKGVPSILVNLNQQRERFRDNFNICFVFLVPPFALKYLIHRAPDFFDWRSGVFQFRMETEHLQYETLKIWMGGSHKKYSQLMPQERTQKILHIQGLIEENQSTSDLVSLYLKLGDLFVADQNFQAAIASYDHTLKLMPDSYRAWINRGIILRWLGRYGEANASFDKVLEIGLEKKDSWYGWYNWGIALGNLKQYEESIVSLDHALEIKPDNYHAWHCRGFALKALGRYKEAISSYEKALEIQPNLNEVWVNKGIALRHLGQYKEAIASFNEALTAKPDDHKAWNNLGCILHDLGLHEEAIVKFNKAIEIQSNYASAYYNKACAYVLQNQIELALDNLQQAITFSPKDYKERAKTDSDFDSIRDDLRFQALVS